MPIKVVYRPWMDGLAIEGCKRVGDILQLDVKTEDAAREILNKAGRNTEIGLQLESKAVSGDALNALKSQFPSYNFDSGKVFKCIAANTKLDRDTERFSKEILDLFAKQINDKPITVMWQHDRDTHGLGRMLGASVTVSQSGQDFDLMAYILVDNEARIPEQGDRKLAPAVENQYVTDVSIGFRAYGKYIEEKINGEARYIYTYGIDPERPETRDAYIREVSFVDFGAQVGAGTFKAASHTIEFIKESRNMTKTVEIEVGGVKHALTIDVAGEAITVKGESELNAAIKAASDAAATKVNDLQKSVETLSAPLIADVVNAKLPGLDESTVKAFPAEKLIETAKEVTNKGVKSEDRGEAKSNEIEKAVNSLKW